MSPRHLIPESLESLIIRRMDATDRAELVCDMCDQPARWRVVMRWDVAPGVKVPPATRWHGAGPESLITHLCAADGYGFVVALGDNLRAGEP